MCRAPPAGGPDAPAPAVPRRRDPPIAGRGDPRWRRPPRPIGSRSTECPSKVPEPGSIPARGVAQEGAGVVTKLSPRSVAETVSRLVTLVEGRGMKVFAVIDHSGEAARVGLELRDTKVVIFGSPQAGTPVMAAAPPAALDLPLKVLVWADGDQTKVSYTSPAQLAARYGLSERAGRQAGRHRRPDRRRGRRVADRPLRAVVPAAPGGAEAAGGPATGRDPPPPRDLRGRRCRGGLRPRGRPPPGLRAPMMSRTMSVSSPTTQASWPAPTKWASPAPVLRLGAVVHADVHATRDHVAGVHDLAALGARDRLHVLRPPPARLEHRPGEGLAREA